MTAQTESDDGDVIRTWAPQAIIYEHDSSSLEAYLVVEGAVEIFAPLGLKLVEAQVNSNKDVSARLSSIHQKLNGEMIFSD